MLHPAGTILVAVNYMEIEDCEGRRDLYKENSITFTENFSSIYLQTWQTTFFTKTVQLLTKCSVE